MKLLLLFAAGMAVAEDTFPTLRPLNDSAGSGKVVSERILETDGPPTMMAIRPIDCQDLFDFGDCSTGLRYIYPDPARPYHRVKVYCEQMLDGGGWTVFQRRTDRTVREDFNRSWIDYRIGFGNLLGEFWLGNDNIHLLTFKTLQEIRVDLYDWEGNHRWAKYGYFFVGPESTKYRLHTERATGNAGDSLGLPHDGRIFLFNTPDQDNSYCNSRAHYHGAWWYAVDACSYSNLNGNQEAKGPYQSPYLVGEGITWFTFNGHYSHRHTTMMIRPAY